MRKNLASYAIILALGVWLSTGTHAWPIVNAPSAGLANSRATSASNAPALAQSRLRPLAELPLTFEANQGQTDPSVRFLSRGSGRTLFLTGTEAVLTLRQDPGRDLALPFGKIRKAPTAPPTIESTVRLALSGAGPTARVIGLDKQLGRANYFIGRDPSRWRTNIPIYGKVKYQEVLPGVDLVYYGNQRQLESDFIVAPGTDPGSIAMAISGGVTGLDREGNLTVVTPAGEIVFHKPVAYQWTSDRQKQIVDSKFALSADNLRFAIGNYDRSRSLVIDPVLTFSTYLGGSAEDRAAGIAVDKSGNVILAGSTESADFPTKNPIQGFVGGCPTCHDLFVTKFNPTGTALIYSTFIGGSGDEESIGATVDAAGNLYDVGYTTSSDFPVTAGAFQTTYGGSGLENTGLLGDAFVLKLNAAGSALVYSSYLGGSSDESAEDVAVDAAGNAYVSGTTTSSNFPVTSHAFQRTCPVKSFWTSCYAGFAAKVNSTGSALDYATYLADTNTTNFADTGLGIAVDHSGNAYVVGEMGPGWVTTVGAFQTTCTISNTCDGLVQGYVAKLNPQGRNLVWSTYLGSTNGGGPSEMASLKVDSTGAVYVTGLFAQSGNLTPDFPVTAGAAQTAYGGGSGCLAFGCGDITVSKLNSAGSALVYSTYLGGSGDEAPYRLQIDSQGDAYVVGETTGSFPVSANAIQSIYGGGTHDAAVTEVNPIGSAFTFSTYLGGNGEDVGRSMTVDDAGNMYVTGRTGSTNFPVTPGVFQSICGTDGTCNGGFFDAIASKISPSADLRVTNHAPQTVNSGATLTYTITAASAGPDQALNVQTTDTVPSGATFNNVSVPAGVTCTHPASGATGKVVCTIPVLASGGSAVEQLTVNITAVSGSTITDRVTLVWGGSDPNLGNNSATARTHVN